ncbi:GNAT family N-acetyltransferase [Mucilaginibacter sp. HD30]
MLIRKAKREEANIIAPYLLMAMGDIAYNFIGESSPDKATAWLETLISKSDNQYSFENCMVVDTGQKIIAAALVYNGSQLQQLRQPVAKVIKQMFNRDFNPEDETEPGEYYIDCIAVNPEQRGQKIGTKLLQFLIDEYVYKRNETLGLLVDKDNPAAQKLYLKLGFKFVGNKTFAGKQMEHLQLKGNNYP